MYITIMNSPERSTGFQLGCWRRGGGGRWRNRWGESAGLQEVRTRVCIEPENSSTRGQVRLRGRLRSRGMWTRWPAIQVTQRYVPAMCLHASPPPSYGVVVFWNNKLSLLLPLFTIEWYDFSMESDSVSLPHSKNVFYKKESLCVCVSS